jgi:hypothetical protein
LKRKHPVFLFGIMEIDQEIHGQEGENGDAAQVYPESGAVAPWFCIRRYPLA